MKNLEITQEKVIEAANKCPQAEEVLKTLFPEAFESAKSKYINLQALTLKGVGVRPSQIFSDEALREIGVYPNTFMEIRTSGQYMYQSFYLPSSYDWLMITDSENVQCLVPTKKDFK